MFRETPRTQFAQEEPLSNHGCIGHYMVFFDTLEGFCGTCDIFQPKLRLRQSILVMKLVSLLQMQIKVHVNNKIKFWMIITQMLSWIY